MHRARRRRKNNFRRFFAEDALALGGDLPLVFSPTKARGDANTDTRQTVMCDSFGVESAVSK
jgi:hypothetical protein